MGSNLEVHLQSSILIENKGSLYSFPRQGKQLINIVFRKLPMRWNTLITKPGEEEQDSSMAPSALLRGRDYLYK